MKRMTVAALAVLMAVPLVTAAGCTGRGPASGAAGIGATSPSPPPDDPTGGACPTVLVEVGEATDMQWTVRDDFPQATADDTRKYGARHCNFNTTATGTYPAAIMAITFYRIDRPYETPEGVRDRAVNDAKCTEQLASPPAGVVVALQCLRISAPTWFNAVTLLSVPRGYVRVVVITNTVTGTPALHSRALEISRETAIVALDLL